MKKLLSFLFIIMFVLGVSVSAEAIELSSDTVLLMDAETGQVLYESNGYQTVPSGSFGKLLNILTAVEHGKLSEKVTVLQNDLQYLENPVINLKKDEVLSLGDLLYAEMLANANDAARAVARHFITDENSRGYSQYIKMMAKEADYCLASTMTTDNVTGAISTEQMSSCVDLANLIRFGLKDRNFRTIFTEKTYTISATDLTEQPRTLTSSHKMVNGEIRYRGVRGGFVSVHETGEYRSITYAERRLGKDDDVEHRKLIAVVLHSSSQESMYQDVKELLDYGFRMNRQTIDKEAILNYLPDVISNRDIVVNDSVTMLLPRGTDTNDLEAQVTINESGYLHGTINFYQEDSLLAAKAEFFEKNENNIILLWVKRIGSVLLAIAVLALLFFVIRYIYAHQKNRHKKTKPRKRTATAGKKEYKKSTDTLNFSEEYENDSAYWEYQAEKDREYLRRRYAETDNYEYGKEWLDRQEQIRPKDIGSSRKRSSTRRGNRANAKARKARRNRRRS